MFVVKCIPIVGTSVTALEAVGALIDGDPRQFGSKLIQTGVGAALDTAFVMTGGVSSLATAPLKAGAVNAGCVMLGMNVMTRATTQSVMGNDRGRIRGWSSGSGKGNHGSSTSESTCPSSGSDDRSRSTGGGDDPSRQNPKVPKEHEVDEVDYDTELYRSTDTPITKILLGPSGRVEKVEAVIKKRHLRRKGQARRSITARVRRFVNWLGQVRGGVKGIRESDEVGHIIGDLLSGPHDRTYNYYPQSPQCNMEYYHKVEKLIYDYLETQNGNDAYVKVSVEMVYGLKCGMWPNRPNMVKVKLEFSDGTSKTVELSNM